MRALRGGPRALQTPKGTLIDMAHEPLFAYTIAHHCILDRIKILHLWVYTIDCFLKVVESSKDIARF
jgi:hypothetical protein